MAAVEIQGLTKSYGANQVLHDLNLQVGEGEFVTLLGPSGCGKTTTLRCVAGLERADGGEIRIGGTVVASGASRVFVPPNRRDIGMVFQSYALWPHMTVAGNVGYPLRMRRGGSAVNVRQRVTEILETVGMAAFAQRHVTDLSGGQQQRVALARAMVAKPGLLLFDEPLSNLDAKLRRDMRREIRAAHDASGGSSIYVTHDQEEAITLSDRVVVLRVGVVQQVGTPRDIYEHPVNTFVADFVGYDNILAGTVTEVSDGKGCAVHLGSGGRDGVGPIWAANGPVKAATVGARAFVAVRAEHLAVEPLLAAGDSPEGTLAGLVASRTYTGHHVEYVIEVGDQRLLVRMSVEQQATAGTSLDAGDKAAVRFNPGRTVLIKETAAG